MNRSLTRIALAASLSLAALGLAAGTASADTSTATPEAAADNTSCASGHWPGWVDGRPIGVHPQGAQGVYMWHDGYGWHLRVTHKGTAKQVFEVKITAPSGLYGVERLTERGDVLVNDGTTLLMRFTNYGGLDGIDFRVHCGPGITRERERRRCAGEPDSGVPRSVLGSSHVGALRGRTRRPKLTAQVAFR